MRVINMQVGLVALLGCACVGSSASEDETGDTSETLGESETGGEGETGGEPDTDPLGLDDCPPFDASEPAPLPAAGWADLDDDHELMCALRALDAAVEGRRVLCLAENSHGVSQSYLWHALALRYLVHAHGVRTVAFEATRARGALWDDYAQTGDLAALDASFNLRTSLALSVETEWLVEALAAVSAELPAGERLRLTGYDVAVQPQIVRAALLDYVELVAPAERDAWAAMFPVPDGVGDFDWFAAGDAAAALLEQLEASADAYVAATDAASYDDALVDAAALRDGYYFRAYYTMGEFFVGNATFREPSMAVNVEHLLATLPADELLVIVGHNRHCARDWIAGYDVDDAPTPALGTYLAQAYADDYGVLAQAYAGGSYTRLSEGAFVTEPFETPTPLLEASIAESTDADALLVSALPEGSWELFQQSEIVVAEQFDQLLWLREVEGTSLREGG